MPRVPPSRRLASSFFPPCESCERLVLFPQRSRRESGYGFESSHARQHRRVSADARWGLLEAETVSLEDVAHADLIWLASTRLASARARAGPVAGWAAR